MHLHWTRSELVASALGYAGKMRKNWPEADQDAPHGRSRINLRKNLIGTHDLAAMYLLVVLVDKMAAPDGFAPPTCRFKVGCSG